MQDFARSILRMDDERMLWWERSQELAKKCDAQAVELERVTARLAESESDREDVRERVREACATLREVIGANGGENVEEYAERAAARITELEARLAAVAPVETDEVDGFRVGDLVRFNHEALPLLEVFHDETVGFSFGTVVTDSPHRRKCSQLQHMVRKPVEVGDTVRVVGGHRDGARGRVDGIIEGEARVVVDPNASLGDALWVATRWLVAVAQ